MTQRRSNSREKILAAAVAVAKEAGPGGLSLDAVAARAGVSKGGLLYNFPSKAKLLEGLVATHIANFQDRLEAERAAGGKAIDVYVDASRDELEGARSARSWVLTAMVEHPEFMQPVKAFHRKLLDRLLAEADDPTEAVVAYLAIEGLRSLALFDGDILSDGERDAALGWARGRTTA